MKPQKTIAKTPTLKTVTEAGLRAAGFKKGMGGAWYYPGGSDATHIHLVTSGAMTIKVTEISWKQNGQRQGNLHRNTGGSFNPAPRMPQDFKAVLQQLQLTN